MKKIIGVLVSKSQSKNIRSEVNLPEKINAPIIEGEKLGEITYYIDDSSIATVNLVSKSTIKKLSFPNMLLHTIEKWFSILRT